MELMTKKQVKDMVKVFVNDLNLPTEEEYEELIGFIMKEVMTDYEHVKVIVDKAIEDGTVDELPEEMFMFVIEGADTDSDVRLHIYYDKNDMCIFRNGKCIIHDDVEEGVDEDNPEREELATILGETNIDVDSNSELESLAILIKKIKYLPSTQVLLDNDDDFLLDIKTNIKSEINIRVANLSTEDLIVFLDILMDD